MGPKASLESVSPPKRATLAQCSDTHKIKCRLYDILKPTSTDVKAGSGHQSYGKLVNITFVARRALDIRTRLRDAASIGANHCAGKEMRSAEKSLAASYCFDTTVSCSYRIAVRQPSALDDTFVDCCEEVWRNVNAAHDTSPWANPSYPRHVRAGNLVAVPGNLSAIHGCHPIAHPPVNLRLLNRGHRCPRRPRHRRFHKGNAK